MLKCSYNQMGLPVSTQPDGWIDGWISLFKRVQINSSTQAHDVYV